jgi:hypothetical protein
MFNVQCSMFDLRRSFAKLRISAGVLLSNHYSAIMKHGETMLICTVAGVALCLPARAVTSDAPAGSPYQGIVERNVFGLKPPPPPPDPEANKPPPPKITLQGITTFGGVKRALLKAQMPVKPGEQHKGEPPKGEESFILAEGQREGDIEVLEINDKPGSEFVKVNDFGTITNLNFENNGIKTAAASGPGPTPAPAGVAPNPGASPFPQGGGGKPYSPTRPMRTPGPPGAAASSASYGGAPAATSFGGVSAAPSYGSVPVGATAPGGISLPGFATSATPTPTAAQQQQQQPALTGEGQAAVLAAQQIENKDRPFPPLPPPIAQMLGEGSGTATATPRPGPPSLPLSPGAVRTPPPMPQ